MNNVRRSLWAALVAFWTIDAARNFQSNWVILAMAMLAFSIHGFLTS